MNKTEFIRQWLIDNDLWPANSYIDPFDEVVIDWYAKKLNKRLPELYQLLVDNYNIPSGEYHRFLSLVQHQFNKQRHEAVIGDLNG